MPTPLPDAEQDVLAALYDLEEAAASDVRQALATRRPLTHSSIVTLLMRLEKRGLVRRRKADVGKAFLFRPTRPRARVFGPALARLLDRAFAGRPVDAVASFFESTPPTREELADLEQLVKTLRQNRPSR